MRQGRLAAANVLALMAADDTPEPPVLTPWENHGGYEFISGSAMLVRLLPLWGIRLLLRFKWWT